MWDSDLSAVDQVCQLLEKIYTYACIASKMLNELACNTFLTDHEKQIFLESYRVAVIHALRVHPALLSPWHTKIHTCPSHEENCVSLGAPACKYYHPATSILRVIFPSYFLFYFPSSVFYPFSQGKIRNLPTFPMVSSHFPFLSHIVHSQGCGRWVAILDHSCGNWCAP